MNLFANLNSAIKGSRHYLLRTGEPIVTEKWQGRDDLNTNFFEALNWSFSSPIPQDKDELAKQVKPNLSWCDAQFNERVMGSPLNPGESYKIWPYYKNNQTNDKFRTEGEQFSHTYMERFWPKHAGNTGPATSFSGNIGIRYPYGDYQDMVNLLVLEPNTRQAYLPIWFPEDTGVLHGGRVPCTLGYWFIKRQSCLHLTYHIRACDYYRHFRDDIYLAGLLVQYTLSMLQNRDPGIWAHVTPGILTMHIGSFHIFASEIKLLQNEA